MTTEASRKEGRQKSSTGEDIMNHEIIAAMQECSTRSHAGTIHFPEVVRKLAAAGVERYHADLCRGERTYYMPSGESHIDSVGAESEPIAGEFTESGVVAALRAIQRGEILYLEFLRRIQAAGCCSYFVLIAGRRALYFGRKGEVYEELFPSASTK
jgi:uncharacterized protein YbcV (DUF1398 family)